jgi:hypothetical protein
MSDDKKRDRALQRRVRERQAKTGETYQAAWQQLTNSEAVSEPSPGAAAGAQIFHRIPLPFSTGSKVLPGQSAQITARPQVESFWPDRLLIKNADRWDIERLTVGRGKSPWSSIIDDAPRRGSAFSLETWHPLTSLEVPCAEPVVLVVSYTGSNEQGESFEAVMFGWDGGPPTKPADRRAVENSERVSERAESRSASVNEMVVLAVTVTSPALFVDRFTITDAKNWVVHDIRTRGKSIFVQNGDLPGEMFSGSTPVILEPLATDDLVEIAATYVGNDMHARLVVELSGTAKPTSTPRGVSCFLPISTDVPILATQSAKIDGQSRSAFLLERIVIADPDDWIVNDIKIGYRSLFAQTGDLPGQAFSSRAVGCELTLEPVPRVADFTIVTTRGEGKEAAGFFCGVQGRLLQV